MGDLLEHLAKHLLFLSMATLLWYSLNSSYDHEFHLSRWLGMNPKDYEYILVAANLAHHHPTWGFIILVDRLKMFLKGHQCNKSADGTAGSFEVALKKIDLDAYILGSVPKNRKNVHVICTGQITDRSPQKKEWQKDDDSQMITTPPGLSGLRLHQQSFWKHMDLLIWIYVFENCLEAEEGDSDSDSNSSSIDKDETSVEEDEDVNKEKKNPSPLIVMPVKDINNTKTNMARSYPHLSKALGGEDGFFDPTDPLVQKSMRSLLRELNRLLSTTYELNTTDMSNNKISYVQVPWTSSDHSFVNTKEWIDTAIQIAGSKHSGTFKSAYRIVNHMIKFYRDSFLLACENQKIPINKEMSSTQFQAMLSAAKVSGTGERELKKHLSAHLGKGFCPTRRSVDMLAKGHLMI